MRCVVAKLMFFRYMALPVFMHEDFLLFCLADMTTDVSTTARTNILVKWALVT